MKQITNLQRRAINRELAKENKKSCTTCNRIKPIEAFYSHFKGFLADGRRRSSLSASCKLCDAERANNMNRENALIKKYA